MPMVPRPACEPTTGPMSPTTISPSTCGRSISTNCVDVAAVGVQHDKVVEAFDRGDLVDQERQRLAARALLATLLDLAVAHLDDRLDRQAPRPASPWRRRCGRPSSGCRACRAHPTPACVRRDRERGRRRRRAWRRRPPCRAHDATIAPRPSVAVRLSITVTGIRSATERAASSARLHRGRQRAAQGDGDDAACAVGRQSAVGRLELPGGGRRGLRQRRRGRALRPELGDGEVATIDELVAVDADGQRDDLDAELVGHGLREVACRVGDDADAIGAHGVLRPHKSGRVAGLACRRFRCVRTEVQQPPQQHEQEQRDGQHVGDSERVDPELQWNRCRRG